MGIEVGHEHLTFAGVLWLPSALREGSVNPSTHQTIRERLIRVNLLIC